MLNNRHFFMGLAIVLAPAVVPAFAIDQNTPKAPVTKQQQTVKPPTTTLPPKGGVVAVPAKVTLECGGRNYELTTGNGKGDCNVIYAGDGKTQTGASCSDGKGNSSSASCGKGGCTNSSGAGSCTAAGK